MAAVYNLVIFLGFLSHKHAFAHFNSALYTLFCNIHTFTLNIKFDPSQPYLCVCVCVCVCVLCFSGVACDYTV
jgi:hypothetical protein